MHLNKLGNKKGSIPQVGFGTYQLQGNNCKQAIFEALKLGYNHIDTASIYKNEQEINLIINDKQLNIQRENLFITSKISPAEQGTQNSLNAVEQILKRLNVSYLDLVLIHWPGVSKYKLDDPKIAQIRLESWKSLIDLKNKGVAKHIGVSNFNINHLQHLFENSDVKPEVNQFEIHPLCYDKQLIKFCEDNNIIIEAYSSLARQDEKVIKNQFIVNLSLKYKKTVPQILLRWAIQHNFVIIPKSKTPKYIQENLNIFDFEISQEDMQKLDDMNQNYHTCWDPSAVLY
ncbi:hypothetical protein IMG5_100430 [Ichthyophthirius multifiliis]|uniref:NADP-dependent oxidoreductase domain-containing protein n=1 Tax=Ichthyophthirius multifiliis TaxID=5932 RepID=G0QSE6_ICHMU|nr:hypothetical protein IMG5_100430 [Ichthyophthirius multifiliis]EGR31893.1 hypothetical protein IMG5_100430 [Ichthyophthirius multifiliis]|eukprot:XP_004035379.1 hypothetical protein IMG5_100430 [Ichthyophthirius multifiliis]